MKVTCSKEKLLEAISKVQGAVSPKTTLPILSNVLLQAEGQSLTLTTTDLDIGIQYTISVEVVQPGATTLPAKRLFSIIRELPPGDISIVVDSSHVAVITSGSACFKIVGLDKSEFPKLPEFPDSRAVELPQELLKEIINKTSYAISHDESRHVLNGLYFLLKSGKAIMVGTDGRRLAFIEKRVNLPKGLEMETIIPAKTLSELAKLLDDEGLVDVVLAKNQIAFKIPNCILVSRLIEGRFPNYKQVIPDGLEEKINISKEELLSAVRRSALITNDRSNSIKLNFASNNLVITANTPDVGESRESLNIPYEGKEIDIAFNPNFIVDVLKNTDEEEIVFEVTDSVNPGIIRTGSEFLYVIMPMRIT